jgi:hypothetical protein
MWPTAASVPAPVEGKWLKTTGGAMVWSDIAQADVAGLTAALAAKAPAPAYGITLPAAPVDGQEAILVDSLTVPTYTWRFRYNAGSTSAYKWEFIGGAPSAAKAEANLQGNGTFFTGGVPYPRAGDWWHIVNWAGANAYASSLTQFSSWNGAVGKLIFTASIGMDRDIGGGTAWANWLALGAGGSLYCQMVSNNNNNIRTITHSILPVRVA